MKKEKSLPTHLVSFNIVYKVKGRKYTYPYYYSTFTTVFDPKKLTKAVKKHLKVLYKEINCKLLKCELDKVISTQYKDDDPTEYVSNSSKNF